MSVTADHEVIIKEAEFQYMLTGCNLQEKLALRLVSEDIEKKQYSC